MSDDKQYYYRFEDRTYALPLDEYDEPQGTVTYVKMILLEVVSKTPKGAWLKLHPHSLIPSPWLTFGWEHDKKFFCLDSAKKGFARSTQARAVVDFIERKKRQRDIYKTKAQKADKLVHQGECMLGDIEKGHTAKEYYFT